MKRASQGDALFSRPRGEVDEELSRAEFPRLGSPRCLTHRLACWIETLPEAERRLATETLLMAAAPGVAPRRETARQLGVA